jgi:alkylhydroperoxidase family enzyme
MTVDEGTGPRLAPTTVAERDDETNALVDALGGLNIFATLVHHPKALKRWLVFGGHVLAKSTLPEREREFLILRVGWRCGSEYEFGQHTVIGRRAGITAGEVRRLTTEGYDGWSDDDALWVRAADELVAGHRIGDDTWAALAARLTDQQIIDLLFTVGQYVLVSMALNTLGVERDEGVPGWPA